MRLWRPSRRPDRRPPGGPDDDQCRRPRGAGRQWRHTAGDRRFGGWGYFIHANVRRRFGWAESVIATPAFHRWHHANGAMRDRDYASALPLFDRLFATLHLPGNALPETYGIDAEMPAGLVAQLAAPLMPHTGSATRHFSADSA